MDEINKEGDDLILVNLEEERYYDKLINLLRNITKDHKKVCYLCLNRPYNDVLIDIQKNSLDVNNFFFIDTLASYYKKQENLNNCIFIDSPRNIEEIKKTIKIVVNKEGCEGLFVDTISSLLLYNEGSFIIRLVHDLKSGIITESKNLKRSFLISLKRDDIPKEDYTNLLKDLSMFSDEVIQYY